MLINTGAGGVFPGRGSHPRGPPGRTLKSIKKSIENKVPKKTTLWAPRATKKAYSDELYSQNTSKREPKMDTNPDSAKKWKLKPRSGDSLILTVPDPLLRAPFSLFF